VRVETLKAERNAATEEVAKRKRAGTPADELLASLKMSADAVKALDADLRVVDEALEPELLTVPNLLLADVPDGDATQNRITRTWGAVPSFDFVPRPHWELGESLGILDLANGAKVAGSGFPILRGMGAKLVRALANFMLDLHTTEHGYEEVAPPYLVNKASMQGTGQLPKFGDELYTVTADGLYLIPTSEVPLTNMVRESIVEEAELPMRLTAYTPCFRAEAGAAGRDTRGMIRQHQFNKVELVSITTPEQSKDEHERMLACAEEVLRRLGLHYRVVTLCGGDMGFPSQKTYDIEVWLPGQGMYREISSCSNCGDFQARRMDARYRTKEGRTVRHVHTLNGSGVAVGRALVAVMETYQQDGGSIAVPDALQSYMGGKTVIEKAT